MDMIVQYCDQFKALRIEISFTLYKCCTVYCVCSKWWRVKSSYHPPVTAQFSSNISLKEHNGEQTLSSNYVVVI